MRHLCFISVLLSALCVHSLAFAIEPVGEKAARRSLGVGASLSSSVPLLEVAEIAPGPGYDAGEGFSPYVEVLLPINLTHYLRLEPYVGGGFRRISSKEATLIEETSVVGSAGAAVFVMQSVSDDVSFFAGPVLGLIVARMDRTTALDPEGSRTTSGDAFGYRAGLKVGFEFFATSTLSLGADVSVNTVQQPFEGTSRDGDDEAVKRDGEFAGVYTQSYFTVRWYL